jgi:hypothetical protein
VCIFNVFKFQISHQQIVLPWLERFHSNDQVILVLFRVVDQVKQVLLCQRDRIQRELLFFTFADLKVLSLPKLSAVYFYADSRVRVKYSYIWALTLWSANVLDRTHPQPGSKMTQLSHK